MNISKTNKEEKDITRGKRNKAQNYKCTFQNISSE